MKNPVSIVILQENLINYPYLICVPFFACPVNKYTAQDENKRRSIGYMTNVHCKSEMWAAMNV